MKIVINGGNFSNKGAQAMLLVTMSELKKRYPNVDLYYTRPIREGERPEYFFKPFRKQCFRNALGIKSGKYSKWEAVVNATKFSGFCLVKHGDVKDMYVDYKYVKEIDDVVAMFDISGFNLTSKFDKHTSDAYLDIIECASKLGIPFFVMPQSFGPFDYKQDKEAMQQRIKEVLSGASLVFAREEEGYKLLTDLGTKNVYQSDDIVLQAPAIEWKLLCDVEKLESNIPEIKAGSIAVVPNQRVYDRIDSTASLDDQYKKSMDYALSKDKNVYLIWHSSEDLAICRKLKSMYQTNDKVILIEQELNCFEYEQVVKHFDYIIASRFHSLVLAFRQGTPAIGIGWAIKYQNLFGLVGQSDYVADAEKIIGDDMLLGMVTSMEDKFEERRAVIKDAMTDIQKNSCFEKVFELLDVIVEKASNES